MAVLNGDCEMAEIAGAPKSEVSVFWIFRQPSAEPVLHGLLVSGKVMALASTTTSKSVEMKAAMLTTTRIRPIVTSSAARGQSYSVAVNSTRSRSSIQGMLDCAQPNR
jgi:hypothetical protein